ncbi:MAG: GumC family protein, partial [Candidatus Binatia bacterium]
ISSPVRRSARRRKKEPILIPQPNGFRHSRPDDFDEINLLEYWQILWKRKWLIGGLCLFSVVAALIGSLLTPKSYDSTVTIMLPKDGGGSGLLSAFAASGLMQQLSGISLPSLTPNRDIFLSILRSRSLAERLVEQFKLIDYYNAPHLENALRSLQGATKITISKEGVISVKVQDRDPEMAAVIANAYADHLDKFMARMTIGTATNQRRFIGEQLRKTEKELRSAEEGFKEFQERNRAVLLGDMANSMRLPGARVPQVGLELGRMTRDLKVQEAIYMLLTQQLEQAKINEAQDTPVVQVLDRAVPPMYKSGPKIRLNMALAGAVSLFLGSFLAFFLSYLDRQRALMRESRQ